MSETTCPTLRRNRADWERLMAQYETGGLKQRVFCEHHAIGYSTFCYWRWRLRRPASVEKLREGATIPLASASSGHRQ